MTTLTVTINEKSDFGKLFLDFIKVGQSQKNAIEVVKIPNATTLKAMEEAKNGKVIRAKNVDELFKKLTT